MTTPNKPRVPGLLLLLLLFTLVIFLLAGCDLSSLEVQQTATEIVATQSPVVRETVPSPAATAQLSEVTRTVIVPTETPEAPTEPSATHTPQVTVTDPASDDETYLSLTPLDQAATSPTTKELVYMISGENRILQGCFLAPTQPTLADAIDEIEVHGNMEVLVCGWRPNEEVVITMQSPTGTITRHTQVSAVDGATHAIHFFYQTNVLEDAPCAYTVTFEGDSGTVVHTIQVDQPLGPHMYFLDDKLCLVAFQPLEEVIITGYTVLNEIEQRPDGWRKAIAPYGQQTLAVDETGQGVLDLPSAADPAVIWYAAAGRISGEAPVIRRINVYDRMFAQDVVESPPETNATWPTSPTGIEACHLVIGQRTSVVEGARLWSRPNVLEATRLSVLPTGTGVEILDGPVWGWIRQDIDASGWWWQVNAGDEQGWLWQARIGVCQ